MPRRPDILHTGLAAYMNGLRASEQADLLDVVIEVDPKGKATVTAKGKDKNTPVKEKLTKRVALGLVKIRRP